MVSTARGQFLNGCYDTEGLSRTVVITCHNQKYNHEQTIKYVMNRKDIKEAAHGFNLFPVVAQGQLSAALGFLLQCLLSLLVNLW